MKPHSAKQPPGVQTRVVATRVLDAVLHRGRSLKAELSQALPTLADPRDRALVEAICFAVLRQPARFESALSAWMSKPLGYRDGELKALLFVGLAQLDPLKLPAHAALASTVDAARAIGRTHQAGLVNALLRRAQREGVPAGDAHAHWPAWLRERIAADWPQDETAILDASVSEPPMWLRVNRRRTTPADYLQRLRDAGIAADLDENAADALRLEPPVAVAALPGFADGDVSVQDASAQLVIDAMSPASGARVLDACVAPGGKAAHLLERDATLRLSAIDIDAQRLVRVRENLSRLKLGGSIQLAAVDAADTKAWWDGVPFDAVLLDAPCSATGIVRRQPDVLQHRRASDLDALIATQTRLLDALWTTVAPGGVLLYATCSILKAENEAQVEAFLSRTPDAVAEPLDGRFGRPAGAGRQRLPGEHGYDGFYYARLRKRSA
ncbi:16S rRNA (cytosine(967)-C(5))-methyltransferase RsmB [Lysobacter auxotrophicus]|uniref:16S rRNA (cytosine(967)-C(5))-methyltransferase n=1 Tax=Lysobacter auxotrophicus TaxID=2992573 RepID=A0ABM8D9A4_9GAMM|nr:16S rRNA (cytosine(967)-C(5))-methyltransferase RsmB [Lysobacter auxotrophicus]BDU15143.1 16S rRNA (cytosine(967)-C(5))-methyltransferase RsmB [Lysobacter auxotrophicus]